MNLNILKKLISVANSLDSKGLAKESDTLDRIITKLADEAGAFEGGLGELVQSESTGKFEYPVLPTLQQSEMTLSPPRRWGTSPGEKELYPGVRSEWYDLQKDLMSFLKSDAKKYIKIRNSIDNAFSDAIRDYSEGKTEWDIDDDGVPDWNLPAVDMANIDTWHQIMEYNKPVEYKDSYTEEGLVKNTASWTTNGISMLMTIFSELNALDIEDPKRILSFLDGFDNRVDEKWHGSFDMESKLKEELDYLQSSMEEAERLLSDVGKVEESDALGEYNDELLEWYKDALDKLMELWLSFTKLSEEDVKLEEEQGEFLEGIDEEAPGLIPTGFWDEDDPEQARQLMFEQKMERPGAPGRDFQILEEPYEED